MDNPEETAWVFDSLVGFLHGPVWNAPLQTFIEEKSLTFEPLENGEIPNREEYTVIHEEYKSLVDLMLGSYMEDIGITPEQFEAACQMSREGGGLPLHFHQRLFEQIWAANDYSIFTRMMTQRNVELQIQALELIEQRSGMVPHSYSHQTEGEAEEDDQDAVIMEQVKKLSLEESEDRDSFEVISADVEPSVEEIHKEKQTLMSALDHFQKHVVLKEADANREFLKSEKKGETLKMNETFKHVPVEPVSTAKPQKEEIEQRQQYLKQQRDKLLALKKQIREKQLAESTGDASSAPVRPKSSRNAKLLLSGDQITPQDSSLQVRKALADRLRSEVVEKL